MGEHCSVCWRKFFTKDMHLNWLRMNRRVDSKWLKISNQPLHLYPLLHLYICLWVCAKLLQSCPTLCHPVDCSPPGSSVHRILQARILDWVAMPSSKKSSWPRNWNHISCGVFTTEPLRKHLYIHIYAYIYISSVVQLCLTLCNPMDCSMPGFPVHHQILEFTQTHVHRVSDAIQPSHPLSSPSPPAPNPSQHQGFFQWVNSSHEVAKVLEFQLQHQSFQWIFRTDFL